MVLCLAIIEPAVPGGIPPNLLLSQTEKHMRGVVMRKRPISAFLTADLAAGPGLPQ